MNLSELTGLLERVREASGPDREIDAQLWCVLHGYRFSHLNYQRDGRIAYFPTEEATGVWGHQPTRNERYTGSVDLGIALAERVLPGASITVQKWSDGAHASIQDPRGGHGSNGATPALAMVAATISALLAKLNPGEAGR